MSPALKNLEKKLGLAHLNPLALLRLSPKTRFEHVIERGYSTDVLGWFGEAWMVFRSRRKAIVLASLPSALAAFIMIFLFYRQQGRATTTSVLLYGSYLRSVLMMTAAVMPSFVALGALSKSEDPRKDYLEALWRLPGILLISAMTWVPMVYSGFMGEIGVTIRWWAVPIAIYLAVAYSFAPYLAVDGRMDFWTALETSRRAVSRNWFGIASIYAIYYLAAWVFSAALSMLPGIFSTILVVDEMTRKLRTDPLDIMYGFSNAFMAGLFYIFLIFFHIIMATAYIRIFHPVGYRKAA